MNNKSFTLIELLVVIVIIGILAGVIMISTSSSINKANIAKLKVFDESVQNNLAVNMVSKWSFDGSTTAGSTVTINDVIDVWSSNNADAIGGVTKVDNDCVSGKCIKFNGSTGDYVQIPHSINLQPESITITSWVKLSYDGTRHIVINKWTGWALEVASGGEPYFRVNTSTGVKDALSSNSIKWGEYSFLVGTFDEDKISYSGTDIMQMPLKIYIDGVLKNGANTGNTLIAYGNQRVRISDPAYTGGEVNGFIDEMKIYDAVLSYSQIKQNYIAGLDSMLSKGIIQKEIYNQKINELAYEK